MKSFRDKSLDFDFDYDNFIVDRHLKSIMDLFIQNYFGILSTTAQFHNQFLMLLKLITHQMLPMRQCNDR